MNARKRVFLGLVATLVVLLFGAVTVVSLLARSGDIGRRVLVMAAALAALLALTVTLGVMGMVFSVARHKPFPVPGLIRLVLDLTYPATIHLGPLFRIPKEWVQTSFVAVNNGLVEARLRRPISPERILVLVPHCLQRAECTHKITIDVDNCRRCGACQVASLLALRDEVGVQLAVATGGGMARKIVHDLRPEAVIAVACERDLTSGLLETFPLPVFGVVNDRPEGYCLNTGVDMQRVRAALALLTGHSQASTRPAQVQLLTAGPHLGAQPGEERVEQS